MGDEDRCSDAPAFASSALSERVSADDRFMACSPCVAARYSFSPNLRSEGVGAHVREQCASLPLAGVCFTLRGEKGWDLKAWLRLRYSQLCLPLRFALSIRKRSGTKLRTRCRSQTDSLSASRWDEPFANRGGGSSLLLRVGGAPDRNV